MKRKVSHIDVVAASVRGAWHENKNLPCQDCFAYNVRGQKLVAVVADGAGSAKYGKIGARIVCETLCDLLIKCNLKDARRHIVQALEQARQKLMYHRLNRGKDESGLIDFAATVVGALCYQGKGVFFHIGDGAAMALLAGPQSGAIISQPENGIFSCETYFYTMDDWQDSLRFTAFEKARSIMLMTDGVTGFAFKNGHRLVERNFVGPIDDFLGREKNRVRAEKALSNTLSAPRAQQLNPDDKTLLWARLEK